MGHRFCAGSSRARRRASLGAGDSTAAFRFALRSLSPPLPSVAARSVVISPGTAAFGSVADSRRSVAAAAPTRRVSRRRFPHPECRLPVPSSTPVAARFSHPSPARTLSVGPAACMQPGSPASDGRSVLEPRKALIAAAGVPSPGGVGPVGEHADLVVVAVACRHRRAAARYRALLYAVRVAPV